MFSYFYWLFYFLLERWITFQFVVLNVCVCVQLIYGDGDQTRLICGFHQNEFLRLLISLKAKKLNQSRWDRCRKRGCVCFPSLPRPGRVHVWSRRALPVNTPPSLCMSLCLTLHRFCLTQSQCDSPRERAAATSQHVKETKHETNVVKFSEIMY